MDVFNQQRYDIIHQLEASEKAIKAASDYAIDTEYYTELLIDGTRPIFYGAITDAAKPVFDMLGVAGEVTIDQQPVIKFVDKFTNKYAKATNKTTVTKLRKTLQEGINAGESIPQLRDRVNLMFDSMERSRATQIARTETVRASNFGAEEAMIQSGVVEGKEWLVAYDERTCEFCLAMESNFQELGTSFFEEGQIAPGTEGGSIEISYADVDNPPLHVSCRCTIIPVVKER